MSPLSHNRPAPADVFILGAGFSKAISRDMPLLAELSSAVAHQMAPNDGHVPFLSENIELALTFLAQPQPWMSEGTRHRNRAAFLDVTETIAAELTRVSAGV